MVNYSSLIIIGVMATLLTVPVFSQERADSIQVNADSVPVAKRNLIQKVIHYFETSNKSTLTRRPSITFIGGPHYSSDSGFGIGLVAAGNYSTCPEDITVQPSNISIFANLTTGGHYKVGIEGIHNYDLGKRRINYEVSFKCYRTYFWGIGYDAGADNANKGKYMLMDVLMEANHLWRLADNFYLGPLVKFNYFSSRHVERPEQWEGLKRAYPVMTVGFEAEWDTRDNFTYPRKGWLLHLTQRFAPSFLGNRKHAFSSTEIGINHYAVVWKGGVIAARLHGMVTYGHTPWGAMPSLGGGNNMRGYYEGQYIDKCETDATIELRQHVWRRSGLAVWGGLGAVYPSLTKIRSKLLLPNFGIGYRWELKKNSNVRVDAGFGRKCWGFVLNMNEAF